MDFVELIRAATMPISWFESASKKLLSFLFFALKYFEYGIKSQFGFTVTVEQHWIVGPAAYGHVATP